MANPFWLRPSSVTQPPLADDMIRAAEEFLGVKFPHSLLDLLRRCNGGRPRKGWFTLHLQGGREMAYPGLINLYGIPASLETNDSLVDRRFLEGWDLPPQFVTLFIPHTECTCLDYRDPSKPEPSVVYVDTQQVLRGIEHELVSEGASVTTIAPTFAAFIEKLYDGEPFMVFGFAIDDRDLFRAVGLIEQSLHIQFSPGGRNEMAPFQTRIPFFARRAGWNWSLGDSSLAQFAFCKNQDDDGYLAYPEFPECNWTLRCDVHKDHRELLVAHLQSSGLEHKVLHWPPNLD
jgi:hypothetical protein